MNFRQFYKFWLPAILWAIVIFSFSSVTVPATSPVYWQDFTAKKLAHFIEYSIFGILFYRAFINSGVEKKKAVIYTIIISLIYAATDEFHQSFTPKREPRVRDIVIDTISAGLVVYLIWKFLPKAPKKLKDWAQQLDLN